MQLKSGTTMLFHEHNQMVISYIYQKSQYCNCRRFGDDVKSAVPTTSSRRRFRSVVVVYGFFFLHMSAPYCTKNKCCQEC